MSKSIQRTILAKNVSATDFLKTKFTVTGGKYELSN